MADCICLQTHHFNVNTERDASGDLLIHVAVQGGESVFAYRQQGSHHFSLPTSGLPSLPLLLSLLNHFSADISARDGNGMTPLSLACRLGHVRVVEVWCTWCLLLQCFIMLCAPCRCWCVWEELIWAHGAPPWARLLCTVLLSMVILTSSGDDAATLSTHNYPPPLCAGCCFAEGQMPLLKMRTSVMQYSLQRRLASTSAGR